MARAPGRPLRVANTQGKPLSRGHWIIARSGEIGRALYPHYETAMDDTYLFLADGRAYSMSEIAHEQTLDESTQRYAGYRYTSGLPSMR